MQLFQPAHHAVTVLRIDLRIRFCFLKQIEQTLCRQLFQFPPIFKIRRDIAQHIAIAHSIDIQSSAAHQKWHLPACSNIVDRCISHSLEICHSKESAGGTHVDQIVRNTLHFIRRDFPASQIQSAINLSGVC